MSRQPGYLLQVREEQLDSFRLEALLEHSREACERGALHRGLQLLKEAERVWRGPPLADLRSEDFAQNEIARLEELRLLMVAERVEVEVALGGHAYVVAGLTKSSGSSR